MLSTIFLYFLVYYRTIYSTFIEIHVIIVVTITLEHLSQRWGGLVLIRLVTTISVHIVSLTLLLYFLVLPFHLSWFFTIVNVRLESALFLYHATVESNKAFRNFLGASTVSSAVA